MRLFLKVRSALKKTLPVLAAAVLSVPLCTPSVCAVEMPEVSAKAAIVINAETGETLFGKNADVRLPMASTTKIMTTILAIEHADLDEQFTVDPDAVRTEGSSMGLRENDKVTLRALCYGMMLPSGNDAANCTAVRVAGSIGAFVELMNKKAKSLGLENTRFVTPSGLDDFTDEHYSTASDMAKLTRYAMNNETFAEICNARSVKLCFGDPPYDRWLTNTNKLLRTCHGVIGVKTGFTDKAGRCLVSCCERNGSKLICVTLNDRNDWQDHSMLYDKCFPMVSKQVLDAGRKSFDVSVVGSDVDTVKCTAPAVKVSLVKGSEKNVRTVVRLPAFVYSTVIKGQQLGTVEYWYNGELIAQSGIFARQNAEYKRTDRDGFLEIIKQKLVSLFA